MKKAKKRILVLLSILWATSILIADVKLPSVFGDGMVLQRNKPVCLWGWADPGEKLKVQFAGQAKEVQADAQGEWMVKLDAMEACATGQELIVEGKGNKISLKDVLVGEVWICGGQSNMEWTLRGSRDADVEIPAADYPAIRFFKIPHIARLAPQKEIDLEGARSSEGNWQRCVPEQAENCTAVGYYFARRLHRCLKVPVGLIDVSWGGTMAQHWVSTETLRKFPEVKPYFEEFEMKYLAWTQGGREEGARKRYEDDVKAWEKKRAEARAEGKREPRRPNFNAYTNPAHKRHPGGMYNGMIMPISRCTVRGVLFYQGENNSFGVSWKPFHRTFPAVISDWRAAFGEKDLPFGLIQIAGWSNRRSMTYDMNHHTNVVREIQFNTWRRTPDTGLIVTFDTNTTQSIHPGRKLPVGERSARWALAKVYGFKPYGSSKPVAWRGPVYKSMEIQKDRIVVSFEECDNPRLVLDQDEDAGFYIAGKDRVFHHARARVHDGTKLQVWCPEVPEPVAVRYGWSNLPAGGFMNTRELPAYPFRTDTWPMVPHQSTGAYEVDKL